MNAKQTHLIESILAIINKASVANDSDTSKLHNSASAEHWLARGFERADLRLSFSDDSLLFLELLSVDNAVIIPLPTLAVLSASALDNLASILASLLYLAMSKCTGSGSDRYPELARLLAPIVTRCMSPVQQTYQHKLLTGETSSRTVASKNPADFISDKSLVDLIADESISFSLYASVITLTGHKRDLSHYLSADKRELLIAHKAGSFSLETKGVMMIVKYKLEDVS
jgi:hypothetical protein